MSTLSGQQADDDRRTIDDWVNEHKEGKAVVRITDEVLA